ncbi:hypothetical protein [Legionella erythra]|uniref:Lipoprotein n=1 Tax=Legionella erythra TaxID=448 RepID=A0A0W0TQB5_LEGER|nr:hypothetical protein [Legionella erythra]KTC97689.1 hypothetical protein Lery_1528 [Legionella erythra]
MHEWINSLLAISLVAVLSGCQFPDDPNQTLNKIRKTHRLKAGVCLNHTASSDEMALLKTLAKHLNAEVIWFSDPQDVLYRRLQDYKIDIVACAIHQDSPWSEILAFTVPYDKNDHAAYVLAVPPGENAWLKQVNEFIEKQRTIQHAARD